MATIPTDLTVEAKAKKLPSQQGEVKCAKELGGKTPAPVRSCPGRLPEGST